jgi:hypothetical protein
VINNSPFAVKCLPFVINNSLFKANNLTFVIKGLPFAVKDEAQGKKPQRSGTLTKETPTTFFINARRTGRLYFLLNDKTMAYCLNV